MAHKVRLLSPWRDYFEVGEFKFSGSIKVEEADALLCEWIPNNELFCFPGPKAWYCCEATTRELFRDPQWLYYKQHLKPSEFLYHGHPIERYRVPHVTHVETWPIDVDIHCKRRNKAIAIVSNTGGNPWSRSKDTSLRCKYVTHPLVTLYGREVAWQKFRAHFYSLPRLPRNYQGELKGRWHDIERYQLMSQYKAAICLENSQDPYYFTEKFVSAVQAGCIPIYQAHKTVAQGILQGALWVDPAAFGYDVDATLEYALNEDIEKYWIVNQKWLDSNATGATHILKIFERIGNILCNDNSPEEHEIISFSTGIR